MEDPISQLRRLGQLATLPEPTRLLLEFLSRRLALEPAAVPLLADLLGRFIALEGRYQAAVGNFASSDAVTSDTVGEIAEVRGAWLAKARRDLGRLCDAGGLGDSQGALAHLLFAPVCSALGDVQAAAQALRHALGAGLDDPAVHYALGAALLELAQQKPPAEILSLPLDPSRPPRESSREALLEAVSALEGGLTGGPLDARLYQTMSVCLERAGFAAAARDARASARAVTNGDPAHDTNAPLGTLREADLAAYLRSPSALGDLLQGADDRPSSA